MKPQAFQPGEIRDENDNIIQNGAYGKLSAFVNAQNDGILDYLMNNLETLNNAVLGNYLIFPTRAGFPETGDASKVYIDNGTGKPYKWNGTGYTELNQKDLVIVKQDMLALLEEAKNSAKAAKQSEENAKTWDPTNYAKQNEIFPLTSTGMRFLGDYNITDLNDIKCVSYPSWICSTTAEALTMANCPAKTAFFLLNIRSGPSSDSDILQNLTSRWYYAVQIIIDINGFMWRRRAANEATTTFSYGAWYQIATTADLPSKLSQLTNDANYATKTELENGFTTASLTVSGETSVPTPSTANNSKTIANTEFVHGVVSDLVNGEPTALDTLQELASALGNDPNFATTVLNKIGEKESKTDAQIEYKKLQNGINACLESKAGQGITPETNPQIIAIPLEKGMFPIQGYPDGFTVADHKYPYSLVVNLQGDSGTLLSLYAQHMRSELYFRIGWPDERGWGKWVKLAITDDIDAIKPYLLTGNDALYDYLHRFGKNPTLPTINAELNALGTFICYFDKNDVIKNQPSEYGQLINIPATNDGSESTQLWIRQNDGQMYHRGGNYANNVDATPFVRFLDEDDYNNFARKIPTRVSQLTDDVGIAKMRNGHLVINGSELWIE